MSTSTANTRDHAEAGHDDAAHDDAARDPDTLIRADRLAEVRLAYEAIARQIARLRSLDLQETHPAVIFRPVRREGETR